METICRLCGKCDENGIAIFGEEGHRDHISLKIQVRLDIEISVNDPLPKYVCVYCLGKLDHFWEFYEQCRKSQHSLRRLLLREVEINKASSIDSKNLMEVLFTKTSSGDTRLCYSNPHNKQSISNCDPLLDVSRVEYIPRGSDFSTSNNVDIADEKPDIKEIDYLPITYNIATLSDHTTRASCIVELPFDTLILKPSNTDTCEKSEGVSHTTPNRCNQLKELEKHLILGAQISNSVLVSSDMRDDAISIKSEDIDCSVSSYHEDSNYSSISYDVSCDNDVSMGKVDGESFALQYISDGNDCTSDSKILNRDSDSSCSTKSVNKESQISYKQNKIHKESKTVVSQNRCLVDNSIKGSVASVPVMVNLTKKWDFLQDSRSLLRTLLQQQDIIKETAAFDSSVVEIGLEQPTTVSSVKYNIPHHLIDTLNQPNSCRNSTVVSSDHSRYQMFGATHKISDELLASTDTGNNQAQSFINSTDLNAVHSKHQVPGTEHKISVEPLTSAGSGVIQPQSLSNSTGVNTDYSKHLAPVADHNVSVEPLTSTDTGINQPQLFSNNSTGVSTVHSKNQAHEAIHKVSVEPFTSAGTGKSQQSINNSTDVSIDHSKHQTPGTDHKVSIEPLTSTDTGKNQPQLFSNNSSDVSIDHSKHQTPGTDHKVSVEPLTSTDAGKNQTQLFSNISTDVSLDHSKHQTLEALHKSFDESLTLVDTGESQPQSFRNGTVVSTDHSEPEKLGVSDKTSVSAVTEENHQEGTVVKKDVICKHGINVYKCVYSSCFYRANRQGRQLDKYNKFWEYNETGVHCTLCSFKSLQKHQIIQHIRLSHLNEKEHACPICSKKLVSKYNLNKHVKIHDVKKLFKCETCAYTFEDEETLVDHRNRHTRDVVYECDKCDKKMYTKRSLKYHFKFAHENKNEVCKDCNKSFKRLDSHIIFCKGRPDHTFKCDVCKKQFIEHCLFNDHMKSHNSNDSFACTECEKKFNTREKLQKHRLIVHKAMKFRCQYCDKRFSARDRYDKHMLSHGNTRNFLCEICSKAFKFSANLQTHLIFHGEKKMKCHLCGNMYFRKNMLESHMRKVHCT